MKKQKNGGKSKGRRRGGEIGASDEENLKEYSGERKARRHGKLRGKSSEGRKEITESGGEGKRNEE